MAKKRGKCVRKKMVYVKSLGKKVKRCAKYAKKR